MRMWKQWICILSILAEMILFAPAWQDCAEAADYADLDLWFRVLPQKVLEENLMQHVWLSIYREDSAEEIYSIDVDLEESREALNEETVFHVVWPGEEIRDPVSGEFRVAGFYRLQLAVELDAGSTVLEALTPIDDGDAALPGWQCPQGGLAIHDLAFKHRPDLYVGNGEKVAPNGPVHPFQNIESHYRLVKGDNQPAWEPEDDDDENYYYFGRFPAAATPIADSSYQVLQASVERDPPEREIERYVTLTGDSLSCLESAGIHPELLWRYIAQLKDGKFASEDELIDAVKKLLFPGYLDEYRR